MRRLTRACVALPVVGITFVGGCGDTRPPIAPTPIAPSASGPAPAPRPPDPMPSGLPALAPCGVTPNYVGEAPDGHPVLLYRRERFPVRVWIAPDAATQAYREGIERGLTVWSIATNGVIGAVELSINASQADLSVQVGTHPSFDCRRPTSRWYGIFADATYVEPRVVRGGAVYICPENFNASPADVLRVAHVVAHEMGHALGIRGHSGDAGDVMYGDDFEVKAPAALFPWVSLRDLNTIGTAYCN